MFHEALQTLNLKAYVYIGTVSAIEIDLCGGACCIFNALRAEINHKAIREESLFSTSWGSQPLPGIFEGRWEGQSSASLLQEHGSGLLAACRRLCISDRKAQKWA